MVTFQNYAGTAYVRVLCDFLKAYSRFMNVERKDHFTNTVTRLESMLAKVPIAVFFMLSASLLPPTLLPEKYMAPFGILFPLSITVDYLLYGMSFEYILYVFLSEIRSFLASREEPSEHFRATASEVALKAIYNNIYHGNKILIVFFLSGLFLNITFLSWSFLWGKSVYLNAFQITSIQLLVKFVPMSMKKISNEKENLQRNIPKPIDSNNLLSMISPIVWTSPSRSNKIAVGKSMFRPKKVQCKAIVVKNCSESKK